MRWLHLILVIGIMAGLGAPAIAQDSDSAEETASANANDEAFGGIVVSANREGNYTVKPGDFREMIDAYYKWRSKYAPGGELFLQLRPAKDETVEDIGDVAAQLSRDGEIIDLAFDETWLVKLPVERLGDGKWELAFNQVKGKLRVFPTILSPGTSETLRRMGDIRLECRVFWGFYNNRVNVVLRGLFDVIGGCASKRFKPYYPLDRELVSVVIDGMESPQPLKEPENEAYLVPISDKAVPNDALVRITFAEDPAPAETQQ
ncbi:MAG: hypothetical protein AAFX04_07915 [Pseudomonadota bacterium]